MQWSDPLEQWFPRMPQPLRIFLALVAVCFAVGFVVHLIRGGA